MKTEKSSAKRVRTSLHAHTIVALALSAIIYILAITGTISVFNHELQRWEQPHAPEMDTIAPEAAAKAAAEVFKSEQKPTTHLYINFPQPDLPRTVITTDTQAFFADETGNIWGKEHFPWTQFLLDLHYYLHLPHSFGLFVVGAMGVFMLVMTLSGFMAHPRIFRDAFTLRRGKDILPLIDLHNRLSVWTSPFHISSALSGALLGMASILAFLIAALRFDGDINQVYSPIFGSEPSPNAEHAPLASIENPIRYMHKNFPELPLTYFILHDPGTQGQHINVIAKHDNKLIFGDYYNFDASGNYKGNIGISDGDAGQQIFGSVYNVHFGNWGGLPIKLAYAIFGLCLCIMIASGLRIYCLRRRQKGEDVSKIASAWEAVIWGTPALLACTFLASYLLKLSDQGLILLFWLGLVMCIILATKIGNHLKVRQTYKITTAILLFILVISHDALHPNSILSSASVSISSILLSIAGLIFYLSREKKQTPTKSH